MGRICTEARSRVRPNVTVRDMDVPAPNTHDGRRLEVVVDGLPVLGGAQVAIDTTFVCALFTEMGFRDGGPRGVIALKAARTKKEATCPELFCQGRRAQLVVLAVEVGGPWSEETKKNSLFINLV